LTLTVLYDVPVRNLALLLCIVGSGWAQNWPQFRGRAALGIGDGQNPPISWDAESSVNIAWKTRIPGLGHSSPVLWGDRLYVTAAISSNPSAVFEPYMRGEIDMRYDSTAQEWRLFCLQRISGKILWQKTLYKGVPKIHRHPHNSYASATPATDGEHVVVLLGSEGLYSYSRDGDLLWKKDLGVVHAGKHNNPAYEWGTASSPVLYGSQVIVLCDAIEHGFLAAFDVKSGRELWRTDRKVNPSWSTPAVYEGPDRVEIITNADPYIQGYDASSGKELWRLGPSSTNTTPTPIFGEGLIFVANGYNPIKPIYAIRPGATGDISLDKGAQSNAFVAWSNLRDGPYMATPLLYRGLLYVVSTQGVITCFRARTGELIYRQRIATGTYSASPVAADGRIYIASEEGDVFVVKAEPEYELLGKNALGEVTMATPAISRNTIYFRTQNHVWAIGKPE